MDALDFIYEWFHQYDVHDRKRTVGIGVDWNKIRPTSVVKQFYGKEAWLKIGNFYAPVWGGYERTKLIEWLNPLRFDYQRFIEEEKSKIDMYRKIGLCPDKFCAFADSSGDNGVLGDGNHRYIDFNYLILEDEQYKKQLSHCRLDVICLENLNDVLSSSDMIITT